MKRVRFKTLITLIKGMQVGNRNVHVDSTELFPRLIILIERAEDTMKYFSYELTPAPRSIFKGNFMQHAEKSQLTDILFHYQRNKIQKERKKKTKKIVESDGPTRKKKKRNDQKKMIRTNVKKKNLNPIT